MRRLSDEQLNSLEETCREYELSLMESPEALSYLHGRGLSTSSADRFRLGLVAEPPAGLAAARGRLAIPTIKRAGVTGFKFRCIAPDCLVLDEDQEHHEGHGKYMTADPQVLYNVEDLDTDQGFICTVEGEPDTWTLSGECGLPTVGFVGVTSWHPHYWRMLRDFSKIFHFEDNDAHKDRNRGAEFGAELAGKLDQVVRVTLPLVEEGKKSDVNRVFRAFGRDYVRGLIGL